VPSIVLFDVGSLQFRSIFNFMTKHVGFVGDKVAALGQVLITHFGLPLLNAIPLIPHEVCHGFNKPLTTFVFSWCFNSDLTLS
jgi:hypothetical protein